MTFEDLPDGKAKVRRTMSTDYGKVAKLLVIFVVRVLMLAWQILISLFGFAPDVENNRILFGLKGYVECR